MTDDASAYTPAALSRLSNQRLLRLRTELARNEHAAPERLRRISEEIAARAGFAVDKPEHDTPNVLMGRFG